MTNIVERLSFIGEDVIVKRAKNFLKTEDSADSVFSSSKLVQEKDSYLTFEVVKVGEKQTDIKKGDVVLINSNGLPSQLNIEGVGIIVDHYAFPTNTRIFSILKTNE